MPRKFSEVLGVDANLLRSRGVFDGFVDLDSRVYVDPFLLRTAKTPELSDSHEEYCAYFRDVLRLLRQSNGAGDVLFRTAQAKLKFKEVPLAGLGHSRGNTRGHGIGPGIARRLTKTAFEIIKAGVDDPAIFELVGLIEDKIGPDLISDMTIQILAPKFLAFSQRIAAELNTKTRQSRSRGTSYSLAFDPTTNRPILFFPMEVLRTLPIAEQCNRCADPTWQRAARIGSLRVCADDTRASSGPSCWSWWPTVT